jgi:succinate-acetate transporter protein
MSTVLLNLHNAGLIELSVMIVSMGIAVGGLSQIITGLLEFKGGNTFGGTAFTAYGAFWWSLAYIWANPSGSAAADGISMGFYILLWGIFSLCMLIGTRKQNRATQFVFLCVTLLNFGLAIGNFMGSQTVIAASGWIGIVCGAAALYNGMGQVINGELDKDVIPLG